MKKKKTLILSFISILTLIGIFFSLYYYFINKNLSPYNKNIKNYITKINNTNNKISTYIANNELNLNYIKSELNKNIIENLIKYKNDLEKLSAPDKYKTNSSNLINGLNNNILIYKQTLSILNNPNNQNLTKAIEDLKSYNQKTKTYYDLVKNNGFNIEFSPLITSYTDLVITFADKTASTQKENKIKESQKNEFINILEDVKNTFETSLKKNSYIENLDRIRKENKDFNPILAAIHKDRETILSIKINLSEASIPENGQNLFKSIDSLLKDYDLYLQDLNHIINTEIATNKQNNNIKTLYKENNKNLLKIKKDFSSFTSNLKNY